MSPNWSKRLKDIARRAQRSMEQLFSVPEVDEDAIRRRAAEQMEAEDKAQRREALQKLAPFAGRLILVTDWGELHDPSPIMTRLALDLSSAGLLRLRTFGVSAQMDVIRRTEQGNTAQIRAMQHITAMLQAEGATTIEDRMITVGGDRNEWLDGLARSAEITTAGALVPAEQVGHLAVVSAVDTHAFLGLDKIPFYGEAILLSAIEPDANPPVQIEWVSLDPHREDLEGL